jgi:hypothetical protein
MNKIPRTLAVCLALVGAYMLGSLQPLARADGHGELVHVLKEIAQYQRASSEAERSQADNLRELQRTQERQMESMRELVRATERCKQ